jgi:hypothetical protein
MLESLDCRSAILVSSPYHMRRIRIIAAHVFKSVQSPPLKTPDSSLPSREGQREGEEQEERSGFTLHTVPSRYETSGNGIWFFNKNERYFVLTERYAREFSFLSADKRLILVTGHRRENFGEGFENICRAPAEIAGRYPDTEDCGISISSSQLTIFRLFA